MRGAITRLVPIVAVLGTPVTQNSALAQSPVVVAILPFEDRGSYGQDRQVFQALTLGIPATLESELRGHTELRLANRDRVRQAIQAQNLGREPRVDAAMAAKIAKQVGARYAVSGSFADFYGKFRLDARIIDAKSGQIMKVVSNDDPALQDRADLYKLIQMVAHGVLAETIPAALTNPKAAEADSHVIPTDAITQYSLGLLYESKKDKRKAGEYFQRALSAYPGYSDARVGIQRVRGP